MVILSFEIAENTKKFLKIQSFRLLPSFLLNLHLSKLRPNCGDICLVSWFCLAYNVIESQSHRVVRYFGLEETFEDHLVQPPCQNNTVIIHYYISH